MAPTEASQVLARTLDQIFVNNLVGADPVQRFSENFRIIRICVESPIPRHFGEGCRIGTNNRGAASHCLQNRKAEPFVQRRARIDSCRGIKGAQFIIINKPSKDDPIQHTQVLRNHSEIPLAIVQRACDDELRIASPVKKTFKGSDQPWMILSRLANTGIKNEIAVDLVF